MSLILPMLISAAVGVAMTFAVGDLGTAAGLVLGSAVGISFTIGREYEKRAT